MAKPRRMRSHMSCGGRVRSMVRDVSAARKACLLDVSVPGRVPAQPARAMTSSVKSTCRKRIMGTVFGLGVRSYFSIHAMWQKPQWDRATVCRHNRLPRHRYWLVLYAKTDWYRVLTARLRAVSAATACAALMRHATGYARRRY